MKKILGLASVFVLSGLMSVSHADGFSYSYLDGEYYQYDDMEIDGGISLSGAATINESLHVLGGYQTADLETFFGDVTVSQFKAGLGVHTPVAYGTDVVLEGALLNISSEFGGQSVSENGYEFSAGVRQKLNNRLEGNLGVAYTSVPDMDIDETSVNVGGRLYLSERFSAGAQYHNVEGDDFFKYSVRMDFL